MRTVLARFPLFLFAISAVALVVFGKRPDAFRLPDGRPAAGRVIVTYWEKWSNNEAAAMQQIVDSFNLSQDRIFVNFVSMSQINQKLLIATAGGDPPDIAGTFASQVAPCAANGTIQPLNDLAPLVNATRYKPFIWNICAPDGHTPYAAAATPVVNALYCNTDMLGNLPPPRTMAELDSLAGQLTTRNPDGSLQRLGFLPTDPGWYDYDLGVYFGNALYDSTTDEFHINTAADIAAFHWYQAYAARYGADKLDTFRKGFGEFNSAGNGFIANKLAMVIQGPYLAAFIAHYNPSLHYVVIPVPVDGALADLDVWVIPRNAPHRAEAMEVIAYFSQQAQLEKLCSIHAKPSPLMDVSPEFLAHHPNPYISVFEKLCLSKNLQTLPSSAAWERVRGQLDQSVAKIWNGADVPSILNAAQQTIDGYVAEQRHNDSLRAARRAEEH